MLLLLFDLDGTLVDSSADDTRLFEAALASVAGQAVALQSWERYAEVTASAIAREALAAVLGRRAREGEVYQAREAQTCLWQQAMAAGGLAVRPVPGAVELFMEAQRRAGVVAAVATGGWGPAALIKLGLAGFPVENLILASSDDAETRAGILGTAEILAAAARGCFGFSSRVVIGDGVWDGRAARSVKGGFVGVASDPAQTMRLRAEGAAGVVPDFLDRQAFWSAVEAARRCGAAASGN